MVGIWKIFNFHLICTCRMKVCMYVCRYMYVILGVGQALSRLDRSIHTRVGRLHIHEPQCPSSERTRCGHKRV
jgi:hypothetical protein